MLIFTTANDSPNLAHRLLVAFSDLEKPRHKNFLERQNAGARANIAQKNHTPPLGLLQIATAYDLTHHWHNLTVVSKSPQNEQSSTIALSFGIAFQTISHSWHQQQQRLHDWALIYIYQVFQNIPEAYNTIILVVVHQIRDQKACSRKFHGMTVESSCMHLSMTRHSIKILEIYLHNYKSASGRRSEM